MDNTVLSNFYRIKKLSTLDELSDKENYEILVTSQVKKEFRLLNKNINLPKQIIKISDNEYRRWKKSVFALEKYSVLGEGELSCIYLYMNGDIDFISTDDKKARDYIKEKFDKSILKGSLGILEIMFEENIINKKELINYVNKMKQNGFWIDEGVLKKFLSKFD